MECLISVPEGCQPLAGGCARHERYPRTLNGSMPTPVRGRSRKSVERFWKEHSRTGQCEPKQIGGYRRSRLEKHDRTLRRWIVGQPGLTLRELQKQCREQWQVAIGLTALWHRLERLGLSYKKNDARRRARSA